MQGNRQKAAEKGKEKQKEQSVQKGMKKGKGMQKGKEFDWSGFGLGEKRILAKEILGACEGTAMSLAAQLETRINPDYTPPIRVLGDVPSMHIARGNLDRDELHSASGHCKGKFG